MIRLLPRSVESGIMITAKQAAEPLASPHERFSSKAWC